MKKLLFLLGAVVLFNSCSTDENADVPAMQSATIGNIVKIHVGLKYFEPNNKEPGIYMQVENPQAFGSEKLILDWGSVSSPEYDDEIGDIMFSAVLYSEPGHDDPNYLHAPDLQLSSDKSYAELIFDPRVPSHYNSFHMGNLDFITQDGNLVFVHPNSNTSVNEPVIGESLYGHNTRYHFYFDNLRLENHNRN